MSSAVLEMARETRASVLAGVAWVLGIWIALRPGIDPEVSTSATAEALARLSTILGNVGGLLILLILSIGLGTISLHVFRAPSIWIANLATSVVRAVEAFVVKVLAWPRKPPKLRRYSAWEPIAVDLARRIIHEHRDEIEAAVRPEATTKLEQAVYFELDEALHQELDSAEDQTYLRSLNDQADLRLAAVVPLVALIAAASFRLSPYFALLFPAPFILAFQGGAIRSLRDATLRRDAWRRIHLKSLARSIASPTPGESVTPPPM
jgi:hypothetical protein